MIGPLITRITILIFGVLYPAYASYKAVKTKNVKEYLKWMMYWVVFAFYTCMETLADIFLVWLPFYHEIKLVFVFWLLSPVTRGASILYRKFIHPHLLKHEEQIDACLSMLSREGHNAVWQFGTKSVAYLAEILLLISNKVNANKAAGEGDRGIDTPDFGDTSAGSNEAGEQPIQRPPRRRDLRPASVTAEEVD